MWHQKQPLRFPQLQVASWVWSRGLCLHLFPNEDLGIKPNLQELSQMTRCQRRHSVLSQPKIKSVSLSWTCSTFLSLMEMEINCWIQIFVEQEFLHKPILHQLISLINFGRRRLTVAKEYNLHCTAAQKLKPFAIYNARHLALTAGASQVVGLEMQKSPAIENAPKLNMDCFNILKVRW